MLRDDVLSLIREQPGIRSGDLQCKIGNRPIRAINKCLWRLQLNGSIEKCGDGQYRAAGESGCNAAQSNIPKPPPPALEPVAMTPKRALGYASSGFIPPPSLSRLMAGR